MSKAPAEGLTENIASRLAPWFAARLGLDDARLSIDKPKTGFSADTLLVQVEGSTRYERVSRAYVVRIEHPGRHTFLGSTIGKQAAMMHLLRESGIPAPQLLGWEEDGPLIGASFLAMVRVDGHALKQHPSYHVAGLLHELTERQRQECWLGALSTIAAINRLPWQGRFEFLHDADHGAPSLDSYLGWLAAWRSEACAGRPHPIVDAAIARLRRDRPDHAGVELLWGDSNPGNFLFTDHGAVAAVLDFEAAAIGPAEIDLSWWFFVDDMLAAGHPSPAGIPSRDEQIAAYEKALGRRVGDLAYYDIVSAVRMSLVMARLGLLLIGDGALPPANDAWRSNPAVQRLAQLMAMPADEEMHGYWEMVRLMNAR